MFSDPSEIKLECTTRYLKNSKYLETKYYISKLDVLINVE